MFIVPCPKKARFLNVEPKSAVPLGKVEGVALALPHGTSVAEATIALQAMSLRVKMRSE